MDATKREQYVREFFADKMGRLAAMPPCLEGLYRCILTAEGVALTYVPATAGRPPKRVPYAALAERIDGVAANVQAKVGPGDGKGRAIIKLANYDYWIEIFWGVVEAGYVPVLLANNLDVHFVDTVYQDVSAKLIITNSVPLEGWVAMRSDACMARAEAKPSRVWADEVVLLSSGTDGVPKTVTYSGAALCRQVAAASVLPARTTTLVYPDGCGHTTLLAWLPFSHVFGFVAVLMWYTFFGKQLVIPERLDLTSVSEACNLYGVTHIFAVPQFWNTVAARFNRLYAACTPKERVAIDKVLCDNLTKADASIETCKTLKRLKRQLLGNDVIYCISGGSDLLHETARTVNAIGYPLYNGYGMTETGVTAVETTLNAHERLQGRIGFPMAGVTYTVAEDGALAIRTVYPPKSIRTIGGETQVSDHIDSGDVVRYDAQKGYEILGRAKHIVVTDGGEKLIPSEIRNAYGSIPYARETAVDCVATQAGAEITLHLYVDEALDEAKTAEIYTYLGKVSACIPPQKHVTKLVVHEGRNAASVNLKEKMTGGAPTVDIAKATHDDGQSVQIADKVLGIVASVCGLDKAQIYPKSHFLYELGVTSMQFFEIVMLIEQEYDIHFDANVYFSCATVMDLVCKVKELIPPRVITGE